MNKLLGVLFLIGLIGIISVHAEVPTEEECIQRIYNQCNYPTTFTDEELENVRQYLNHSFAELADIKPVKPLCPKLHVRQDWKCLSEEMKNRIVKVWKEMYEKGIIQNLTDIHVRYWPAWHKTSEFLPSHRWLSNEFEREMQKIDPGVALPYWDPYTYGTQPERSSLWDTLGHSGNYANGWSVPDGIYPDFKLIPTIKRHWEKNGSILPWFTQEFMTSSLQTSNSYPQITLDALGLHFPPHLDVGGYEGQYSVTNAPYEVLFYMHHSSSTDVWFFKWQLKDKKFLTPLSYNLPFNAYDQNDGHPIHSNIRTDTLTGVPTITIRELFQIGFGDMCWIPDQMVKPINDKWKGVNEEEIPTAVKRIPKEVLKSYFPYFNSNNFSSLYHTLEEVGDCNTVCRPIPKPTYMRDTEAGKRQFEAYRYDNGVDIAWMVSLTEYNVNNMWRDFNEKGYCSPYVTTY